MTDPLLRRKRFILFTGHELPVNKDPSSSHATVNDSSAHPSLASMLSTESEAAMKSTTIISRAKHKIAAEQDRITTHPKEIPPQPSFASILSTEREASSERSTIISRALRVMAERETASSKSASLLMLQPSCWEYHRGGTGLGALHHQDNIPIHHHQSGGEDTSQSKDSSSSHLRNNTEMVQKTFHNHNNNPAHTAYYPRPTAAHKMMETLVDEYQQILLETNDSSHRGTEEDPVVLVQNGSSGTHCCGSLLPKEEEGYHSFGTNESDCGY